MKNSNRKGGAAIVAVLVMIIIVAVGCALMVVTGRKTIKRNESVVAPMPEGYDTETVSVETTPEEDETEVVIPEVKPSMIPAISSDYETLNLRDSTFSTAVLLDCDTNEIVAGLKYDKKIYPASLTKLVTLLVAAENIEDMQAKYKFTDNDIDPLIEENASRAGFAAGDEVTMEDLLYAAILPSGADGTLGLANAIAGSEDEFVKMMNDKVSELGLTDTNFVNASGLHNKQHYTTAQDMAVVTRACMQNDICRKVLSSPEWTTKPTIEEEEGIELESIFHSRLNGYFIDVDQDGEEDAKFIGGKTGFTDEAGYCLASVIEFNGKEYVVVTIKSQEALGATEDTILICENYLPGAVGTPVAPLDEESSEDDNDSSKVSADQGIIDFTRRGDDDESSSQAYNPDDEA